MRKDAPIKIIILIGASFPPSKKEKMKLVNLIILFAVGFQFGGGSRQVLAGHSSAVVKGNIAGRIVNVATQTQFQTAMNGALAGDTIILADGNYTAFKVTGKNGTPADRIVVRSANPFGAIFNAGQLELLNCSYMTFENFRWTLANTVKLNASQQIRLTRNRFQLTETTSLKWIIIQGDNSDHNRVDHNEFGPKAQLGNFVTISGGASQSSQYDLIDHNYFHDIGPRAVNEMESVRVGDSTLSQSSGFTVVEYNLFENCDGDPEIVSIKTNDNTVRYNTFRTSQGVLSARQGNRSSFYGNFFLGGGKTGTGGVRIYGDDHKIYNNYFEGLTGTGFDAPVTIQNGDADNAQLPGADQTKHYRPQRITVANNTLVNNVNNIEIGYTNGGSYTRPPRDLLIADNIVVGATNPLFKIFTAPLTSVFAGNIAFPTGTATVGMTATDAQIRIADPLLTTQNNLQKLTAQSPAINASVANLPFITEDFEGQTRDANRDVGADEFGDAAAARLPLTTANAGLNSATYSVSGRATDADGAGIGGVVVALTGAETVTVVTDAAGYFYFTDLTPGGNYTLAPLKPDYVFNPNSTAISSISSDLYFNLAGTPVVGQTSKTVTGRVTVNNRGAATAYVTLLDAAGNERLTRTNPFGYFRFKDVAAGQIIILDTRSKQQQFAPRVVVVNDELTEINITAQP